MGIIWFVFAAGLVNIDVASAQVICSDREIEDTYKVASDHWKMVKSLSFPASDSLHDTHDLAPPYRPTTIFRVLFDKEVGIFDVDEANRQIRIRQKTQMAVPIDVLAEIRGGFDEYLARSKGTQTEYLLELRANDFQNSEKAFAAAMMRIVGIEAPLIIQYGLVDKIRKAHDCAEITAVLRGYFSMAHVLASLLDREFHGLKDIGGKLGSKGDALKLENDVAEICSRNRDISRLGKFIELTQNEINKQTRAMWFRTIFSSSRSINWQDYEALVRSSLDNMLINTKNQAAVKALLSYELNPKKRTKSAELQIQTLCTEVATTESFVINKVRAVNDRIGELIINQNAN